MNETNPERKPIPEALVPFSSFEILRLVSPCCHELIPSDRFYSYPTSYSEQGFGQYTCPKCWKIIDSLLDISVLNQPETWTVQRPPQPVPPAIDTSPFTSEELVETLGSTVKHDDVNKVITTLNLACNYTYEDQASLLFNAQSSSGKSYIPIEISQYLPSQDVIMLGYCTPTAFFHAAGVTIPDSQDEKLKTTYVDLERKVLIFLDQPHPKLLENLRPLLSHDDKEITLKITDRSEKGGTRTKTVIVRGYPTVLFCTANYSLDEQERTRFYLLSPEVNQEKIRDAIWHKIEKESDRAAYRKRLASDPKRQRLMKRFAELKAKQITQVLIPPELSKQINEKFLELHPNLQARQMRDIGKLLTLIRGYALLNFYQRNPQQIPETDETSITINSEDVDVGLRYYTAVSKANELGLAPEIYAIYEKFEAKFKQDNGITFNDFKNAYYQEYKVFLSRGKASSYLDNLSTAGLIVEQPDEHDKRKLRYVCTGVGVTSETPTPPHKHILCSQECANFHRPACPFFTSHLPADTEKPLKCYGYMPKPKEASA